MVQPNPTPTPDRAAHRRNRRWLIGIIAGVVVVAVYAQFGGSWGSSDARRGDLDDFGVSACDNLHDGYAPRLMEDQMRALTSRVNHWALDSERADVRSAGRALDLTVGDDPSVWDEAAQEFLSTCKTHGWRSG